MPLKPINTKERMQDVKNNPELAFRYAYKVLKKRWPAAEPIIMKHAKAAYNYAHEILKQKRWPEAEPYIIKDPDVAAVYAVNILQKRWPEAEPYIKQSIWALNYYNYKLSKK